MIGWGTDGVQLPGEQQADQCQVAEKHQVEGHTAQAAPSQVSNPKPKKPEIKTNQNLNYFQP